MLKKLKKMEKNIIKNNLLYFEYRVPYQMSTALNVPHQHP